MAGPQTAVAESSQALFCAIADFLGEKKLKKVKLESGGYFDLFMNFIRRVNLK